MSHLWLSFKDFFGLAGLFFKVKWSYFIDYCHTVFRYYGNRAFLKADTSLLFSYLFDNPYRICSRFQRLRDKEDPYTFGETPLTTLEEIANRCALSSEDLVFELGCGRGRTCFWLHFFTGCRVVGVDQVPAFIQRARKVKNRYAIEGVAFREEDILSADLRGATLIYLYGTCYPSSFIRQLARHLAKLPSGTRIISVSYPLTYYQQQPDFVLHSHFSARFTWGIAQVYLQIRR